MERRIDLSNIDVDVVAKHIEDRLLSWKESGLIAGSITWLDNEAESPRPLVTNRAEVRRPMSVGLIMRRAPTAEAEFVVYAGGWADVASMIESDQAPVNSYVELETAEQFLPILDGLVQRL